MRGIIDAAWAAHKEATGRRKITSSWRRMRDRAEAFYRAECSHLPMLSEPSLRLYCARCGAWLTFAGVRAWACVAEECDWQGNRPNGLNANDPDPWCPECGGAAYEAEGVYRSVTWDEADRGVCEESERE